MCYCHKLFFFRPGMIITLNIRINNPLLDNQWKNKSIQIFHKQYESLRLLYQSVQRSTWKLYFLTKMISAIVFSFATNDGFVIPVHLNSLICDMIYGLSLIKKLNWWNKRRYINIFLYSSSIWIKKFPIIKPAFSFDTYFIFYIPLKLRLEE